MGINRRVRNMEVIVVPIIMVILYFLWNIFISDISGSSHSKLSDKQIERLNTERKLAEKRYVNYKDPRVEKQLMNYEEFFEEIDSLTYKLGSEIPYTGSFRGIKTIFSNDSTYSEKHAEEGNFLNGQKEGVWTDWSSSGSIIQQGKYSKNKKVGIWIEMVGGKKSVSYIDGVMNGPLIEWRENGDIHRQMNYVNGKLDGIKTAFYEDGKKLKEVHYVNGKLDGPWEYWHSNGNKMTEGNCVNNEPKGLWKGWHRNGQKKYEEIKDGWSRSSERKEWDENGIEITK